MLWKQKKNDHFNTIGSGCKERKRQAKKRIEERKKSH